MKITITIILCLAWLISASATDKPLSFAHEPYVHPMIVEDLVSMISDSSDQVVAIDLYGSQNSNRYFFDGNTNERPGSITSYEKVDATKDYHHTFSYSYVGRTDSNIIVLYTYRSDGGSMSEHGLLFVTIERDKGLVFKDNIIQLGRERYLLKKLGQYSLGDRYKGNVEVRGNQLFIGKDHGWFSQDRDDGDLVPRTNDWETIFTLQIDRQQISPADNRINRR